jgi:hypothetical protein
MASQRELYKLQHNEELPHIADVGLVLAFTDYTDVGGDTWTAGETQYGPYFQKIPENPFTNSNTISEVADYTSAASDDTIGWYYDTTGSDAGTMCPSYVDSDGDSISDGDEASYAR